VDFSARPQPKDEVGALSWGYSSSDTKEVYITEKSSSVFVGKKKTDKPVTVTVSTNNQKKNVSATIKITVVNIASSSAVLTASKTALNAGETSTVKEKNGLTVVAWASSNTAVATVNSSGVVKAKTVTKDTSVTITATLYDKTKKTIKLTVKAPTVKVSGVSLKNASVDVGKEVTLSASVTPSNATNKAVTWSSSNTKIATVNANGKVKGVKAGTAKITVTTNDGKKVASCNVTVKAPTVKVTGVSLKNASVDVGKEVTLSASVAPSNATNKAVTWSSSNTKIATVNANGKVKGVKAGTAKITVTTNDGKKTASCNVTVKAVAVAVSSTASYVWPVPSVNNKIYWAGNSGFGSRWGWRKPPTAASRPLHYGIDVSGGGHKVVAISDGKVEVIRSSGGYGNHVKITHSNGYISLYAHLNSTSVKDGSSVTKGTQIGVTGATGNVTGAHLHFEVYTDSKKTEASNINPLTDYDSDDKRSSNKYPVQGKDKYYTSDGSNIFNRNPIFIRENGKYIFNTSYKFNKGDEYSSKDTKYKGY